MCPQRRAAVIPADCRYHRLSRLSRTTLEKRTNVIEIDNRDGVLEIVLNNPPVNALGFAVRQGLLAAITAAQTDDAVHAIVICGAGRLFSAGADITEFTGPLIEPNLPEVIKAIEESAKPVVAAMHGMALGGGLEIALGCHYRVATPSAKFGLPEVKLGILPGAGGTQRLPRIIGIGAALEMIVFGDPITARKAADLKLIDKVFDEGNLRSEALGYARTLEAARPTRDRAVASDSPAVERFTSANARKINGLDAPAACIEAVTAAAESPFSVGMKKEQALFVRLLQGDQSKALRHAFFAERAAANIEGLSKEAPTRNVRSVGVVGAGTMGGGIAMNFLSAGIPATILDTAEEALGKGVDVVRRNYEASAAKGRLSSEQVDKAMALLTPSTDFDLLRDCDLIIEAVYEDMDLKKEIFASIDAIAKPGAILASNTSYLSIDDIALATKRPKDVVGLHFFSPANVMKLVEVVRGAKTAPDVLATGMKIAKQVGKTAVVAGVCYGFIGNRMLIPRTEQAFKLLQEGASPEKVDKVHVDFGLAMGPFQMADLAGVDLGWHRDVSRIENLQDALCAQGRWGQKTKAGFYDYDDRRRASPSLIVADIINDFRAKAGRDPRQISDEEVLVRTIYSMINEGYKILEEGIAQRASDIDVVWLYGYGWPRHKGGPMFWGDHIGAKTLVGAFRKYEEELGPDFAIAPLLLRKSDGLDSPGSPHALQSGSGPAQLFGQTHQ